MNALDVGLGLGVLAPGVARGSLTRGRQDSDGRNRRRGGRLLLGLWPVGVAVTVGLGASAPGPASVSPR